MIECFPIEDRASWLEMRKRDVTASAIGALVGEHEYQTALGLYALKTGLIAEDPEETPPMRRGRLLEPVALEMLAEDRPTWTITRGAQYFRDPDARIGATPDATAVDPDRPGFGVVQVKTVEPSIFHRKWRSDDGEVAPPVWIACQAITEAHLTGASWACVTPLVVGFGLDLPVIDIPLVPGLMDRLRAEVAAFWALVDSGTPPDPDYARDGETIAKLYSRGGGASIDLSAHARIEFLCEERLAWSRRKSNAEGAIEEIDAEIAYILKDAELGDHPRFKITRKSQKTGGFSIPAGTTRVLRITRKKEAEA